MSDNPVNDRIQSELDDTDVVLFMKGTPMFPQCGFSAAVVGALSQMEVKFKGINVLDDGEIREGIKAFSNWPTIPQLYVKGEFVGGCDIVKEMYEAGELQKIFDDKGIDYAA
ncbi:MAG: Grx4 family monothiol glutaredoxin [Alphaproteobacteria bacterium]